MPAGATCLLRCWPVVQCSVCFVVWIRGPFRSAVISINVIMSKGGGTLIRFVETGQIGQVFSHPGLSTYLNPFINMTVSFVCESAIQDKKWKNLLARKNSADGILECPNPENCSATWVFSRTQVLHWKITFGRGNLFIKVTVQVPVWNLVNQNKPQSSQRKFTQRTQRKWKISTGLEPNNHLPCNWSTVFA